MTRGQGIAVIAGRLSQKPWRNRRESGYIGTMELTAQARVERSPERVFSFLADLGNHWQLSRRFAELEALDEDAAGGRVRIRGPFGLARVARTRVVAADEPRRLEGRAEIGRATVGRVRWEIEPDGAGSRVSLAATVEKASPVDRLLLASGGAWWLRRIFAEAVERLGDVA
jgi:carbon monoxide dehydrogenase subunit G